MWKLLPQISLNSPWVLYQLFLSQNSDHTLLESWSLKLSILSMNASLSILH